MERHRRLIAAFRCIDHLMEVQSRRSNREAGLTLPQALVLAEIELAVRRGAPSPTGRQIARSVALSAPTVVGILDNLEAKGLISRNRSRTDRRLVEITLTPAGERALAALPSPLGAHFIERFNALPTARQDALVAAVEELVALMGSETRAEPSNG